MQKYHEMTIAGCKRKLPLCEVNEHLDIAAFVMFGDVEITEKIPAAFFCNCSKERVQKAIVSIGKKDLQEMINDGEPIEVKCDFCNTTYTFSVEELKEIMKQ